MTTLTEERHHETAISLVALTKDYPRQRHLLQLLSGKRRYSTPICALRELSLDVAAGENFGIVGRNGSGKTTLLKILATLIIPTSGQAKVFDRDIVSQGGWVRAHLGFVPAEERSFFWRLSCFENLRFFASIYGLSGTQLKQRLAELIDDLDLSGFIYDRFDSLSSGKKQMLSIARGILLDPPLLIVDEPTRSLDMANAAHVRALLARHGKDTTRRTVIIASHQIEDIEELCDRVAVLENGRLIDIIDRHRAKNSFRQDILGHFHYTGSAAV